MAHSFLKGKKDPFKGIILGGPSRFSMMLSLFDDTFHFGHGSKVTIIKGPTERYILFINSLTKVNLLDENTTTDSWDLSSIQKLDPFDVWNGKYWVFEGYIIKASDLVPKDDTAALKQKATAVQGLYNEHGREGFLVN